MKTKLAISGKYKKVEISWVDDKHQKVNCVYREEGKYIIGCDPYRKITLWHRFWMYFGLYKKFHSRSAMLVFGKTGLMYALK